VVGGPTGSGEQSKGDYGFAGVGELGEEFRFQVVGEGHFAGGDFGFGGADEAEFAMGEGGLVVWAGVDLDGGAEDAAGDGAGGVDIAQAGGGVKDGAGGVVGEVFKAGLVGVRLAEDAGLGVAGEVGAVFLNPGLGAVLERGGEGGG